MVFMIIITSTLLVQLKKSFPQKYLKS
ncbi:D-alanine--D-alanine ligase [Streptococcus pneumoniae]|nr:D-alanine--D-alanine ligase [Streptococcus pneumoniae]